MVKAKTDQCRRTLFTMLDADEDGFITIDDLKLVVFWCEPGGVLNTKPSSFHIQRRELDTDADGTVTTEEALDHLDIDGDGGLNNTEGRHNFTSFSEHVYDEVIGLFTMIFFQTFHSQTTPNTRLSAIFPT